MLTGIQTDAMIDYPNKIIFADLGTVLENRKLVLGVSAANLHELRHLALDYKLQKGIETPYQVKIIALPGKKLFGDRDGFYDDILNFEEISTWSRAAKLATRTRATEYSIANGLMTRRKKLEQAILSARGARILANRALDKLEEINDFMRAGGEKKIEFTIKGHGNYQGPSYATIPIFENGAQIGNAKVYLVKLNQDNQADQILMLKQYLQRVQERTYEHLEDAEKFLDPNSWK
jgi:hypothetical protein